MNCSECQAEESVGILDRIGAVSGRAAGRTHLFRAASRFALFRAGGEQDDGLRRRVIDDVAACRRADPAMVPDPEVFPPTFAELFRGGR